MAYPFSPALNPLHLGKMESWSVIFQAWPRLHVTAIPPLLPLFRPIFCYEVPE